MNIPKEYRVINRVTIKESQETGWRVYDRIYKPGTPEILELALNKLGEEGWTLYGESSGSLILTRIKTKDDEGPHYLGSGNANTSDDTDD